MTESIRSGYPVPVTDLPERAGLLGRPPDAVGRHDPTIRTIAMLSSERSSADLERQLGLVRDVGIALTRTAPLAEQLDEVTRALVVNLDAAFARVWSLRPGESVLKLQASAGQYTHLDGGHSAVPVGMFKIGLIAAERVPHLTNDVPNDPRVSDQAWAAREGMVAFAGYPLLVGERIVGVMAMFAKHHLSDSTLDALALIARQLALRIDGEWGDEARQAQRRQLLELFAELPVLIASTVGPEHRFTLVNPLFVRVAGDRALLGRPAREAFADPADRPFLALLDQVYATGQQASESERPVLLDRSGTGVGEPAYLNFTYQPIVSGGQIEGVLIAGVDVSAQVRAVRARDEFLSIAAHELRTPVTGIAMGAQLLARRVARGDVDGGRIERVVETIYKETGRLSALTDELLDVSRLQGGGLPLVAEPVDVAAIARDVADRSGHRNPGRTVQLFGTDEPAIVPGDAIRLDQVFTNLVDNAHKYSPNGGAVSLRIERDDEGVLASVHDDGIGIPPHELVEIFEPFKRAANATKRQLPGLGLGLHICRQIVERHGGRIWAESGAAHSGTTFYVRLPTTTPVAG